MLLFSHYSMMPLFSHYLYAQLRHGGDLSLLIDRRWLMGNWSRGVRSLMPGTSTPGPVRHWSVTFHAPPLYLRRGCSPWTVVENSSSRLNRRKGKRASMSESLKVPLCEGDRVVTWCRMNWLFLSMGSVSVCTADPTLGDICECCFKAQSSKLEHWFCPVSVRKDLRASIFELWRVFENIFPNKIGCIYVRWCCVERGESGACFEGWKCDGEQRVEMSSCFSFLQSFFLSLGASPRHPNSMIGLQVSQAFLVWWAFDPVSRHHSWISLICSDEPLVTAFVMVLSKYFFESLTPTSNLSTERLVRFRHHSVPQEIWWSTSLMSA